MSRKLTCGILIVAFVTMLGYETADSHQNVAPPTLPTGFKTAPKVIKSQLKLADGSSTAVSGRATFTIVQANQDDTVTGTLVYEPTVDARQKIAQASNAELKQIPASVSVKNLSASFQRGSACPQIKLLVAVKTIELAGAQLLFDQAVLNINETPDQLNQLFCSWTRQINVKRQRQGLIAAINRLLVPPDANDETVENKPVKP